MIMIFKSKVCWVKGKHEFVFRWPCKGHNLAFRLWHSCYCRPGLGCQAISDQKQLNWYKVECKIDQWAQLMHKTWKKTAVSSLVSSIIISQCQEAKSVLIFSFSLNAFTRIAAQAWPDLSKNLLIRLNDRRYHWN